MRKIGMKVLVLWIYLDAGGGKYMDPLKGWSYNADPLPALDTYTRHTGTKAFALKEFYMHFTLILAR